MGQKLKGPALRAEAEAVMGLGWDESVLILLQHCREMKQQETRLRLVTLLVMLGCAALYVFTICADLGTREASGSSEHKSSFSRQDLCPTDDPPTSSHGFRIQLRNLFEDNEAGEVTMKWDEEFSKQPGKYDDEKRAIVIPESGVYFVYTRFYLWCQDVDAAAKFRKFHVELRNWSEAYKDTHSLTFARDGVTCSSNEFRSVFVGQLFDLSEGDHVSVWIGSGYELITRASFGAYLI